MLIPRDYLKGMTIMFLHVRSGHNGYLLGQWPDKGWWRLSTTRYRTPALRQTKPALSGMDGWSSPPPA
ncbi:MAG: hypothetical protein ABSH21_03290 [Verrucomicrobiia bacterium]